MIRKHTLLLFLICSISIMSSCSNEKSENTTPEKRIEPQIVHQSDKEIKNISNHDLDLVVDFNYTDSLKHINSVEIGIKNKWSKKFLHENYKSDIYGPYRIGKCLYAFSPENTFVYYTVFSSWIMKTDIRSGEIVDSVNTDRFDFYANKHSSSEFYIKSGLILLKTEDNLIVLNDSLEMVYNFKNIYSSDKMLREYKKSIHVDSFNIQLNDKGKLKLDIEYWYPEMVVFNPPSKRVVSYIFKDSLQLPK